MLLAGALAKDGHKVLVLDCDEQKTVESIRAMEAANMDGGGLYDVEAIAPRFVLDLLRIRGEAYDIVFIDVPRITEDRTNTVLGQLLTICDSVLIPVLGSYVDALSTEGFFHLVEEIATYKKENGIPFKYYGFINRWNSRKDNEMAGKHLVNIGVEMFNSHLKDLKVFTAPSVYYSILDTKEGERRFQPFYKEFRKRFKIK
jgi:chromosome partitioning protein